MKAPWSFPGRFYIKKSPLQQQGAHCNKLIYKHTPLNFDPFSP